MTIILFIIVLFVTVLVHEWGHFYAARKSGMKVEEFGFGIPPKLFSWKKGEVVYSINALPIGGFVRIAGENGIENTTPPERQFDTKPWYLKSFVLVAGVVMNIVLAIVLFTAAYTIGMPTAKEGGTPTVTSVVAGGMADQDGVKVGDKITEIKIDGKTITPINTKNLRDSMKSGVRVVSITFDKGNEVFMTQNVQFTGTEDAPRIGITVEEIAVVKTPFFTSLGLAVSHVLHLIVGVAQALGELVGGIFTKKGSLEGFIGPVGLVREVGGAASIGFTYLLAFTAIISVNLAVLNILPFPALDGGRLLVVLLEALVGKRFPPAVVGIIHGIGFLLLLLLMVALTVGDIRKLL